MEKERVDKALSRCGFGSRKDVRKMLRGGLVSVGGKTVRDPGLLLGAADEVRVGGELVVRRRDVYIMLNKCRDVVCANSDPVRRTVFDLLDGPLRDRLHCMGRLDADTEGLLVLTTDGKLTHALMSPRRYAPKTYAVALRDAVDAAGRASCAEQFRRGFWIDRERGEPGFDCLPSELVWRGEEGGGVPPALWEGCDCLLTVFEGKFHQVKRMFSQMGNAVVYLRRVRVGNLLLDGRLSPGEYRELTDGEVAALSAPAVLGDGR